MNDILPDVTGTWRYLETVVRDIVQSYGYAEIRLPLLEQTELFRRSIGEVTDIVEKEMYTFEDRNGESLTLRLLVAKHRPRGPQFLPLVV